MEKELYYWETKSLQQKKICKNLRQQYDLLKTIEFKYQASENKIDFVRDRKN